MLKTILKIDQIYLYYILRLFFPDAFSHIRKSKKCLIKSSKVASKIRTWKIYSLHGAVINYLRVRFRGSHRSFCIKWVNIKVLIYTDIYIYTYIHWFLGFDTSWGDKCYTSFWSWTSLDSRSVWHLLIHSLRVETYNN